MLEREAQLDANGPEPKCHGLAYDARDLNCTACKLSTTCMFGALKGPIRARIEELGLEKPYFDLTDFEAIPDEELVAMVESNLLDEAEIIDDIAVRCNATTHLAKYRLQIIKAKYSL